MIEKLKAEFLRLTRRLSWSQEIFIPLARLYTAKVFFLSGINKVSDWNTTLYLFAEEYHVPLLSPFIAATSATGAELIFSIFLALGLQTRLSAMVLFVVNGIALISYYSTLIGLPAAFMDHIEWGIILGLLMGSSPCILSIDHQWERRGSNAHKLK